MSINSIISNPVILEEIKNAIGTGTGTGITTLENTDGNVSVSVSAQTGNINLQKNIDVNNIVVSENINILKQLIINASFGLQGQYLTSNGSAQNISWTSAASEIVGFSSGQNNSQAPTIDQQLVLGSINLTNLTIGKTLYCLCMGTYNNFGATALTAPTTLVSYNGLINISQTSTVSSQIIAGDGLSNHKINYSYITSIPITVSNLMFQSFVYITNTPQINTISTDTLDYSCIVAFMI